MTHMRMRDLAVCAQFTVHILLLLLRCTSPDHRSAPTYVRTVRFLGLLVFWVCYFFVLKENRRARTVHSSYVVVLKENRRAHVVVFEGIFLHYGVNY